jgi:hypothetical protein
MVACHRITNRRPRLGLPGEAVDNLTPDNGSRAFGCPGRRAAVSVLLVCIVLLMSCPALVAAISMVDPDALAQPSSWFERLSPIVANLNYARVASTFVPAVVVWRAEQI